MKGEVELDFEGVMEGMVGLMLGMAEQKDGDKSLAASTERGRCAELRSIQ